MNAAASRAWNIGRDPLSFAAITAEIPANPDDVALEPGVPPPER
jgi:hypothetical protein